MLLLRDEGINVLLIDKDLLREWKTETLSLLGTTWVPILDIVNHYESVLATCKEIVVIEAQPHPLNGLAMSLDLVYLCQLRQLEDVDCTWLAVLTDTTNEGLLIVSQTNLGE